MPSTKSKKSPTRSKRLLAEAPKMARNCDEILTSVSSAPQAEALQKWLPSRRWFRGKARTIASVNACERIEVPAQSEKTFLLLFQVNYVDGGPEMYVLPLACAFGHRAAAVTRDWPQAILARLSLKRPRRSGVLYDAIVSKEFCEALLDFISMPRKIPGQAGELEAEPAGMLRTMRQKRSLDIEPKVGKAEQTNSSIIYGKSLILKFFRRLDAGINPELEIERFLAARAFPHSPPLAGALEYRDAQGGTSTMAVMTSFVPGCHDAWEDTLVALRGFYRRVVRLPAKLRALPPAFAPDVFFGEGALPGRRVGLVGSYFQDAKVLGRRTASLHLALASDASDPAFRPEPWTPAAQNSLSESLLEMTRQNFEMLRRCPAALSERARSLAQNVLSRESLVMRRFRQIAEEPIDAMRIRTHGDFHLGQVLHHKKDFLIIDFEGEPALPMEKRRAKESALRDVAGMIYSFFYAANAALRNLPDVCAEIGVEACAAWARYWAVWVSSTFLEAYFETARAACFIPSKKTTLKMLLDFELLRKAVYELGYELNNRPDWLEIASQVLLDLLNPDNPI